MPWSGIVRLITPAGGAAHKGVDAFEDELLKQLEWQKENANGFNYKAYRANGPGGLAGAAASAVGDAPNVIVTDGSMATDAVLAVPGAAGIPIVQGVGGSTYTGINNVTGFSVKAKDTCINQFPLAPTQNVTVLWDDTNDPSIALKDYLVANPQGKTVTPYKLSEITPPPQTNPSKIDGSTLILTPSATFYIKRQSIAKVVEGRPTAYAIYPEREYKKEHSMASRDRVQVYGHLVPFTFRKAALLVDKILRGVITLGGGLPAMEEAEPDRGPSPPP
jgi:hypothetical protein